MGGGGGGGGIQIKWNWRIFLHFSHYFRIYYKNAIGGEKILKNTNWRSPIIKHGRVLENLI